MVECEDNWNCQLENITFTAKVRAAYALSAVPCPGSELEPRRFRLRELTGCF
jgi:hypothetical protein